MSGQSPGYRPLRGAIRQLLRDRDLTHADLAAKIHADRAYLSRVINGHVPLTWDMGHRIAVGLGVEDDAVFEPVLADGVCTCCGRPIERAA